MTCSWPRGASATRHWLIYSVSGIRSLPSPRRLRPRPRQGSRINSMAADAQPKQLLHLVFGGELTALGGTEFKDLDKLDMVGVYPNYASAHAAWRARAQQTVDNAHMRYFIVHMHRLLDPEKP